ncbi:hypothetical protein TNCV_2637401 [Trichonephila clavipes]|nr:hypothetical protein TNCV_2637291 [Trichonephila clavipes]GFX44575.1 hypothetical protein TNCV_2637401 [Trichonephila clavipes]
MPLDDSIDYDEDYCTVGDLDDSKSNSTDANKGDNVEDRKDDDVGDNKSDNVGDYKGDTKNKGKNAMSVRIFRKISSILEVSTSSKYTKITKQSEYHSNVAVRLFDLLTCGCVTELK